MGRKTSNNQSGGSAIPWKTISWIGFLLIVIIIYHDEVGGLIKRIRSITVDKGKFEITVDAIDNATNNVPSSITPDDTSFTVSKEVRDNVIALNSSLPPNYLAEHRPDLLLKVGVLEHLQGDSSRAIASFQAAGAEAKKTGDTSIQNAAEKNIQTVRQTTAQIKAGEIYLRPKVINKGIIPLQRN